MKKRKLGATDLEVTPIGLGCWQFSKGQGMVGKFWPVLADEAIVEIVRAALQSGINWFDTAEVYGNGASEKALSHALRLISNETTLENNDSKSKTHESVSVDKALIASKWWPLLRVASSIGKSFPERLKCLQMDTIDLHQIHHPLSLSSVRAQMKEMAALYHAGKIRAIGVSNFNEQQMRKAHQVLKEYDIPLASNQVKYSMLDRRIEKNGVIDAARELQVSIIAYSPLEQGLLTGKFHHDPTLRLKLTGTRRLSPAFGEKNRLRTEPLINELERMGKQYEASPAQVALNWLTHYHGKTVVAIPGASKVEHVIDQAQAMKFELTPDELKNLSEFSFTMGK